MRAVWLSAPLAETSCSGDSRQTSGGALVNDGRGGGEVAVWTAKPSQGDGRYGMAMPGRPEGRPSKKQTPAHFSLSKWAFSHS